MRPTIRINVKRTLWADSCGYCTNPECSKPLIADDKKTSIGEMAHIEPDSQGGDVSADNLILLCKNCHRLNEPIDRPERKEKLRQWKANRIQQNKNTFEQKFSTFDLLAQQVQPLLAENYQIFTDYGPHTDNLETYKLWQRFEPALISNNVKINLLLNRNMDLLHVENKEVLEKFKAHANEFEVTRKNYDGVRQKLFPQGMLSLFGVKEEHIGLAPNVNALQNLIAKLQHEKRFIRLDLFPEPYLTFLKEGKTKVLYLEDRAQTQQTFFSEKTYFPKNTDLRLANLVFALQVIESAGVKWKFDNPADLTILNINETIRIKLFYSYHLPLADLQGSDLSSVSHVANLHNWNGGPITDEARKYADQIGITYLNSSDFIKFCRRPRR